MAVVFFPTQLKTIHNYSSNCQASGWKLSKFFNKNTTQNWCPLRRNRKFPPVSKRFTGSPRTLGHFRKGNFVFKFRTCWAQPTVTHRSKMLQKKKIHHAGPDVPHGGCRINGWHRPLQNAPSYISGWTFCHQNDFYGSSLTTKHRSDVEGSFFGFQPDQNDGSVHPTSAPFSHAYIYNCMYEYIYIPFGVEVPRDIQGKGWVEVGWGWYIYIYIDLLVY